MTKRDYYEILGISKNAELGEIKKAYRQRAMEFHPDRNQHDPQAEEKFKEASEAYEVLSDSQKRQIYDQLGHAGLDRQGFHHGFSNMNDIFSSFSDIFEDFFGAGFGGFGARRGGSGRGRARKGGDCETSVAIAFQEVLNGVKKEVTLHKEAVCDACVGKGSKSGKTQACVACGGSGQMAHQQGFFMIQTTCSRCRGEGEIISDPCEECRGQGRVRAKKNLTVKVPPGVEDGMSLVLRGEGNAGVSGGPAGDLYVHVHVEPHELFERKGDEIHCAIPVSVSQAALGMRISVPTLEGHQHVDLPEGIDSGEEIRLKKMGFPNVRSGKRADQVVKIIVKTPKKLSKKQKQLLEEFSKL